MAEDKRANPYPFPTAAEVAAAPGDRHTKAARNIAVRAFGGIPIRGFVLGQNDHAPLVRGIREFTESVYKLVDAIDAANHLDTVPTAEEWDRVTDANAEVLAMMEHHGCPETVPTPE